MSVRPWMMLAVLLLSQMFIAFLGRSIGPLSSSIQEECCNLVKNYHYQIKKGEWEK